MRLLQLDACHVIEYMLPAASVTTFYVFFPDPWPKRRHHRRRLFSPLFLDALDRTLTPGGHIHAATDNLDYFAQITKAFGSDSRFAPVVPAFEPRDEERTDFELLFSGQGLSIGRASYRKITRSVSTT